MATPPITPGALPPIDLEELRRRQATPIPTATRPPGIVRPTIGDTAVAADPALAEVRAALTTRSDDLGSAFDASTGGQGPDARTGVAEGALERPEEGLPKRRTSAEDTASEQPAKPEATSGRSAAKEARAGDERAPRERGQDVSKEPPKERPGARRPPPPKPSARAPAGNRSPKDVTVRAEPTVREPTPAPREAAASTGRGEPSAMPDETAPRQHAMPEETAPRRQAMPEETAPRRHAAAEKAAVRTTPRETLPEAAAEGGDSHRLGAVLQVAGGLAAVAGGAARARKGAGELRDGEALRGAYDLSVGTAEVLGGSAIALARTPGLRNAGVGLLGISEYADGVVQAWNGAEAGNVEEEVVGALKAGAGLALIVPNPAVQLAGGVVSLGIAAYEHRRELAAAGAWVEGRAEAALR